MVRGYFSWPQLEAASSFSPRTMPPIALDALSVPSDLADVRCNSFGLPESLERRRFAVDVHLANFDLPSPK
jgi:hypothetical protein